MEKQKTYPVIHIHFELPSFQWADGLYIKLKSKDGELKMCRLNDGQPELYDDGRYMISCTGVNNKGITKTNLKYRGKIFAE